MKLKDRILRYFSGPLLARNNKFKNRHCGETCYIFGNGASLKNMELNAFSDHISIGLAFLCLHNEFRMLNIPYYVLPEPFYLYPFYKRKIGPRTYQENILGKLFKKKIISENSDIALFTSISNLLGAGLKNAFYLYHFGNRKIDANICDIAGAFSFMTGSLHAGIGVAISMGFNRAILVGCDYVFTPVHDGHFYAWGPSVKSNQYDNIYQKLFEEAGNFIELSVITDFGESQWLPYQTYENFTGRKMLYRENTEIVQENYLEILNRALKLQQYQRPIYKSELGQYE